MASKKMQESKSKSQAVLAANEAATDDPIETFLTFLSEIGSSDTLKQLRTLNNTNESLRQQLSKSQAAYQENLQELLSQQQTLNQEKEAHATELESERTSRATETASLVTAMEELRVEREELGRAQGIIEDHETIIKNLTDAKKSKEQEISKLEAEKASLISKESNLVASNEQLQADNKTLREKEHSLSIIQSFLVELTPLESQRTQICGQFRQTFRSAYKLITGVLASDLEHPILVDSKAWEAIRTHHFIRSGLPIPSSNSVPAKVMRVGAALLIYSNLLCDNIFRPTFCVNDRNFDKTLSDLEKEDPDHEAYARAMLLKIQPKEQDERRTTSVADTVKDIMQTLAGIMPDHQQRSFEHDITAITSKASEDWNSVQRIEEKVTLSFDMHDPDEWLPLPMAAILNSTKQPDGLAKQNSADQQRKHLPAEQSTQPDQMLAKAIWPVVFASDSEEGFDLLCPGFGISRGDVAAAEEEVSARASRRTQRQNTGGVNQPKRRRDSAIGGLFFSSNASDGSEKSNGS